MPNRLNKLAKTLSSASLYLATMKTSLILFFIGFALTVEAKSFFDHFNQKTLTDQFLTKSSNKLVSSLNRKRRDVSEEFTSEEVSESDLAAFLKFFIAAAWEGDKADVLASFLEELSDKDTNITVVGWQRVTDEEGKVQEIHTLGFVVGPKPEDRANNIVQDDDDDDEDDDDFLPSDDIKEAREWLEPLAEMGIPASFTMEEYNDEGKLEDMLYMDKDELYFQTEGFAIYNKSAVASQKEVSDFITSLKPAAFGKPSVLKYDVDGKFLAEQSHIKPQFLGYVHDYYETPDNILREGPQVIAEIVMQHPNKEVAKLLSTYYNKQYPEYKWRVLEDPENYYVTRDVEITLSYDNLDLDENSDIAWLVYGVKK